MLKLMKELRSFVSASYVIITLRTTSGLSILMHGVTCISSLQDAT